MALNPGVKLGPYEIVEPIGAGGMGEVYRARDPKLGRDVAIKVLPEEFSQDKDRLSRFEREAKLLAQLSHTNVATLYGLEEANGQLYLAMELVEGETLADRIARGPIPPDEAIPIFLQIAEGLEAAHDKGIIHRDLKPANIKLTPSDDVKILDFGLAKAFADEIPEADTSMSPTITRNVTRAGVILGTAAYMSPEQAKGKSVDKRTDVWSFGVVLYEALTGKRLFTGETVSDVMAAVLTREVDFGVTPARHRPLLERCLERDPKRRLRDIGEARIALENKDAPKPLTDARLRTALPWTIAVVLAISTLVLLMGRARPELAEAPLRRFAIDLPWHTMPNWDDFVAAISPTGTHIAYNGRQGNDVDVYVRALDGLDGRPLADARELFTPMVFSSDGEWIAMFFASELRKVSIHGGEPQILARLDELRVSGLSWGSHGDILLGTSSGLYQVPSGGGSPVAVTQLDADDGELGHVWPTHLPDGNTALMTVLRDRGDPQIAVADLDRGTHETLPLFGDVSTYAPTGHILYRQGSTVFAARFDVDDLTVGSDPIPVLEGVRQGPNLSADGTMLYIPVRGESSARPVWVDRAGRPTPIAVERLDYSHLDLSSTGESALLNIDSDVYVVDLERGTRRLLDSNASFPIWSADGERATFWGRPEGVFWQLADGSADPELLMANQSRTRDSTAGRDEPEIGIATAGAIVPTSWHPETGELAFFDDASDIWILPPDGEPAPFLNTEFNERSGRFSPDGRWMAYVSDETGTYQVYVVPYPGPGAKIAVSIQGGLSPIWSHDGRELYFRNGSKLMAASVTYGPTIRFGQPVELFDGPYNPDFMGHQRYDVTPDGERFLMVENSDDFRIVIVQNWLAELERLVPRDD